MNRWEETRERSQIKIRIGKEMNRKEGVSIVSRI